MADGKVPDSCSVDLSTTSRPGIPVVAELARGPGPEDAEHQEGHGGEGEARTGLTTLHYSG